MAHSDRVWDEESIKELFQEMIEWFQADDKNLFINKFLQSKGIYRSQIAHWIEEYPWLQDEYDNVSEVQEYKLLEQGLFKKLDSTLTKYVLGNKHNYKEKTENTNTHSIDNIDLKELVSFNGGKKE